MRDEDSAIDYEARVKSYEADLSDARGRVAACVKQLQDVDDDNLRYLFAERLAVLGPSIVPDLNRILADPLSSRYSRYLAAWIVVHFGDRGNSVRVLLAEVEADGEWAVAAANVLGRYGITEGRAPILKALERTNPTNSMAISNYVGALRELQGELPDALREKFARECEPWFGKIFEQGLDRDW